MADLILGTAALGGISYGGHPAVTEADSIALMKRAFQLGIRDFETAEGYGHAAQRLSWAMGQGEQCTVYYKSDNEKMHDWFGNDWHWIRLLHHWRPEIPKWAVGFSCYSHDNVRTAPGMIVQQDWNLLNQSTWPKGCSYRMARSVFLRGALTHCFEQRAFALRTAMEYADGVVIGPRSIAELEELVQISNFPPPPQLPMLLKAINLGLHPMTDLRT